MDMAGSRDNSKGTYNSRITTGDSVDSSSDGIEEMRCIVVGKTGTGKSSTINTIAGEDLFLAQSSANSVTKECQSATIATDRTSLLIVDTPGLYDPEREKEETLTEIGKVIGITSPGFHAVIIVVTCGRFTPEEENAIDLIADTFGQELYERTVVLCTRVDDLAHENVSFEEYLEMRTTPQFKKLVRKCRDRVVGFNNRAKGEEREAQVKGLMSFLQDIMKTRGYYTNRLYKAVEEMLTKERQKRIKESMEAQKLRKGKVQQFSEEFFKKINEQAKREILTEIEADQNYGKKYQAEVKKSSKLSCVIL